MFDVDDEGNYQLNTKYVRTQLEVEQKGEKIQKSNFMTICSEITLFILWSNRGYMRRGGIQKSKKGTG